MTKESLLRKRILLATGLCVLLVSVAYSNTNQKERDTSISLGDFYYECSRAFKIQLPEGWDRSKAWMLLRATGLKVDGDVDLTQPLRQKHVIQIGTQMGIQLSTDDPDEFFSRKQVESFLTRFQDYFRLPLRKPGDRSPSGRSKEVTPSDSGS